MYIHIILSWHAYSAVGTSTPNADSVYLVSLLHNKVLCYALPLHGEHWPLIPTESNEVISILPQKHLGILSVHFSIKPELFFQRLQ